MHPKEDLGVLVVALVVFSVRGINQRNHDEGNVYVNCMYRVSQKNWALVDYR